MNIRLLEIKEWVCQKIKMSENLVISNRYDKFVPLLDVKIADYITQQIKFEDGSKDG